MIVATRYTRDYEVSLTKEPGEWVYQIWVYSLKDDELIYNEEFGEFLDAVRAYESWGE